MANGFDNFINTILGQLSKEAGPRGYTYAGRVGKPGETAEQILKRTPTGELEAGGQAIQALPGALTAGTVVPFARKAAASIPLRDMIQSFPTDLNSRYKFLSAAIEESDRLYPEGNKMFRRKLADLGRDVRAGFSNAEVIDLIYRSGLPVDAIKRAMAKAIEK